MSTAMQYGTSQFGSEIFNGMELINTGYLGGANSDEVSFELGQHQMYILFTREITISSGAVRGFRARMYVRTENDGALQAGNLYASSNAGVTMTVSEETLTIKPSSASYDVYYSLYAVM